MPQKDRSPEGLRALAGDYMRDAEESLERTDIGEMERQIEQCRLYELAYNLLIQVAIMTADKQLLKLASEQAAKWATNMRSATTKRKNDIVPSLVKAVTGGATWAEAVKALKKREED
ncbi:MAG: hypothetical protein ACRBBM_17480 [Pseudomonadaceae bacterium]